MSFKITLAGTQQEFSAEADESVLEAAQRQGISIPYNCQSGSCGSCKATVLTGHISYQGKIISAIDPDNDQQEALLCCAHAQSDLTLKLPSLSLSDAQHFSARVEVHEALSCHMVKIVLKPLLSISYLAGQYIEIHLNGKAYPLSIACAPTDSIELHILKVPGHAPTETLLTALAVGQKINLYGPLGSAYLRDSHRPVILVAGGSGFAPIKAILEQLLGESRRRQIYLYWGARTPEHLYFDAKLKLWAKLIPQLHYIPVISEPCDSWSGRSGLVHHAVLEDMKDLSPYEAYLAGPFAMSYTAKTDFLQHGMKSEHLYSDAFAFQKPVNP